MVGQSSLHKARKSKNDEFYTQLKDIENEMGHYTKHFKGKVVFCNCDDPDQSQFWKYFRTKFEHLGLKKLVSTHYHLSDLFGKDIPAYKLEYDGEKEKKTLLKEDGDFRSDECVKILKDVDIVITNPPFSLFREYIAQLIKHKKKFLVIGNFNAVKYKEILPLFMKNKLWLGMTPESGGIEFQVHDSYDGKITSVRNGKKYVKLGFGTWYTNIPNKKRTDEFTAVKKYNPKDYPKYDNYNAIEIGKVKNIPKDYKGEMGVPITILEKYNPKQFEIIGLDQFIERKEGKGPVKINGVYKYARIIIKWKELPK